MQFSLAVVAAVAALISSTSAHLTMSDPPQWALPDPANAQAPLAADGSDFPCQNGIPDQDAKRTYEPGSDALLQILGSAVHGGGSAQMLITYDFPPTKDSDWHVMQSWEGDHPIKADGNLTPDPTNKLPALHFTVPKGLKAGKAVMAWSWFNRVGNREHYMKCATVQIGGSSTDSSVCDTLPTMFKANDGSGCTVPENIDAIAFKNPGPSVIKAPGYTQTPIDCDNSKSGTTGATSPKPQPNEGSTNKPSPTSSSVPPTVEPTKVPLGTGTPNSPNTPTGTGSPNMPTGTGSPKPYSPPDSYQPNTPGGACTEGAITCPTADTWAQCASGTVVQMGAVPAGTQCKDSNLVPIQEPGKRRRRSVRFSSEHMRRRHH